MCECAVCLQKDEFYFQKKAGTEQQLRQTLDTQQTVETEILRQTVKTTVETIVETKLGVYTTVETNT